jgi:hypothetical protein
MNRILLLIVLAAFVSACASYTCPTYGKREIQKKTTDEKKI